MLYEFFLKFYAVILVFNSLGNSQLHALYCNFGLGI